ncbi:MAG: hypothetical protein HQL49_07125 [Gammaproteobacteria bacterium]|nr:hypothetical protein [Gammaproteobacteria bacterium]
MIEVVVHTQLSIKMRLMALMSYLGVLVFVPLVMNRDDQYVNFHARQGLIIWVMGIVAIFALYLPGVGKLVFSALAMLAMVYSLLGIVSVLLLRAWKLPFIYNLSVKL